MRFGLVLDASCKHVKGKLLDIDNELDQFVADEGGSSILNVLPHDSKAIVVLALSFEGKIKILSSLALQKLKRVCGIEIREPAYVKFDIPSNQFHVVLVNKAC